MREASPDGNLRERESRPTSSPLSGLLVEAAQPRLRFLASGASDEVTSQAGAHRTESGHRRRVRPTPEQAVLAGVLVLGMVALAVGPMQEFWRNRTATELAHNWGVTVPTGLVAVESHSEPSFQGDGYRIKVFRAPAAIALDGTVFEVAQMADVPLTDRERDLVARATETLQPATRLDPSSHALKKRLVHKPDHWTDHEFMLIVFDAGTELFHVFESHL